MWVLWIRLDAETMAFRQSGDAADGEETMKDVAILERLVASAGPEVQRYFMAACVAHVAHTFDRVVGLPASAKTDVVEPTLSVLTASKAPTRGDVTTILSVGEHVAESLQESGETDLQSIVFACLSSLEIATGTPDAVRVVVNNLDETIRLCDPDGDAGCDEEFDWREKALEMLRARASRDTVDSLVAHESDWERRWRADYNR